MTTIELRKKAREFGKEQGHDTTWIASARRNDCEIYLATGELPSYAAMQAQHNDSTPPATQASANPDNLADVIAAAIQGKITAPAAKAEINESRVKEIVSDMLADTKPNEMKITIKLPEKPERQIDRQHKLFPLLLACCSARINCWLAGPAGSGKTSAAAAAADALGLDFYAESFCAQTPASKLLGYMDATGKYVATDFRRCYEGGGVFCFDEADNANPNVLAVVNSALANGHCSFADGQVHRHEDFILVAGANTFGQGGNRQYIRNQIDAATLDRFYFIEWDYDESFEGAILGLDTETEIVDLSKGGVPKSVNEWLETVQAYRRAVGDCDLRMVISPRASIYGAELAKCGIGYNLLMKGLIFKGADKTTVEKLKQNIRNIPVVA